MKNHKEDNLKGFLSMLIAKEELEES